MVSKKIVFGLFLIASLGIASLGSEVMAQAHLSYGDMAGPFIDFTNQHTIGSSQGDSLVIRGFGERFDLPYDSGSLDSVDFIIDSIGDDSSIAIDIFPVMTSQTSNGPELLPDYSNANLVKTFHFNKDSSHGSRASVSCDKINVGNSFFILLANAYGPNTYRASEQTSAVDLDTARAAFVAVEESYPFSPIPELIDGNLVPPGENVDMDIGITYEGSDGVQMHLSPSTSAAIAFPNPAPAGNPVSVSGGGPFVSAEIIDDAGRIVRTLHEGAGASTTQLPTRGLSAGVYNAILFHSDGSTTNTKFVIE